jgi:23S rRNA pseudouridine1911/1915/1917 synthase
MKDITVPAALDGARLDKVLVELVSGASRAKVRRAIEAGQVRVGGRIRAKGQVVAEGDVVTFDEEELVSHEVPPQAEPDAPLTVLFESPDALVVDKPAGQACAPLKTGEGGTLASALLGRFPELLGVGYGPREPGLLHRLDTDTSGVVIVARNHKSFSAMKDALFGERIRKSYLLLVRESGLPDRGEIAFPLANHPKDTRRVLACIHPRDVMRNAPRPATTTYEVVERKGLYALVRAHASKALRHQIRVHFASMEHPLVGDVLYGGEAVLARHALHAERVVLEGAFDVQAPLPPDMRTLFEATS